MNWSRHRKADSRRSAGRIAALAVFAATLATSFLAAAETFYKWTDAQGNVHYSDKAPKGVSEGVTRIEVDPGATAVPARPPVLKEVAPVEQPPAAAAPDLLQQRRSTRARLEANLSRARERLDLARQALAEVSDTQEGEQQYTQRQVDQGSVNPNATGGADIAPPTQSANADPTQTQPTRGGMLGMAPRSNCRTAVNAAGKKVLICPTLVPGTAYYERQQKLEDDVRRAEEEVADAERAYRRGVD